MRVAALAMLAAVAALATAVSGTAADYRHLDPGGPPNLDERVPVNFVFVGFDFTNAEANEFLAQLPGRYKPIVRSRLFYGNYEEIGIDYRYRYRVFDTSKSWESAFFDALEGLAIPAPLTLFQELYNEQDGTRDVSGNHFIDAPTVEKWLIDHAPQGVNTRQNTVFFVNWWGRQDFIDHVYTKFGEPDPDTGYDFGVNRESRKIIAWGGTSPDDEETGLGSRGVNRVWFHDLSAGPESWGGSYEVTNEDIDGDGEPDFRLPSTWEYAPGGFRPESALPSDLGKLARYAAINLMFTSSPLYPPYITPDRQPSSINLDLNTYEGLEGLNGSSYQKLDLLVQEVSELDRIPYSADKQDLAFRGKAKECYIGVLEDVPCTERPYPSFANLFVFNALNIERVWDGGGEYEALGFNYVTSDDLGIGFLGFADDNWIDGTQSFFFNFLSPGIIEAGYGLTTTQIHEYGHHTGMSHPHDGFDWETGIDYGPSGPFFLAWAGDEHNSMMSYIDLNWDFSQFDRDNANRFKATAYIRSANQIAEDILASPNRDKAKADLKRADEQIGVAKRAMADHDYVTTFDAAKLAYEFVRFGADKAGVEVKASTDGWKVLPKDKNKGGGLTTYAAVDKAGPETKRWAP